MTCLCIEYITDLYRRIFLGPCSKTRDDNESVEVGSCQFSLLFNGWDTTSKDYWLRSEVPQKKAGEYYAIPSTDSIACQYTEDLLGDGLAANTMETASLPNVVRQNPG